MANSNDEGFVWLLFLGVAAWAAYNHWGGGGVKGEREERIDSVHRVDSRVSELEIRIIEMERQLKYAEGDLRSVAKAHESLRKTFNGNVDIDNRAKVARLTAAGACGTETVRFDDGSWTTRNKECTMKDLK